MKAKDTIYRTINGIGLAANGFAMAHAGAPGQRYMIAKAISFGCNVLSYAILRSHNMRVNFKMEKAKPRDAVSTMMKYTAHEMCCLAVTLNDFFTVATDAVHPHHAVNDGLGMATQATNIFAGVDPLKKAYLLKKPT